MWLKAPFRIRQEVAITWYLLYTTIPQWHPEKFISDISFQKRCPSYSGYSPELTVNTVVWNNHKVPLKTCLFCGLSRVTETLCVEIFNNQSKRNKIQYKSSVLVWMQNAQRLKSQDLSKWNQKYQHRYHKSQDALICASTAGDITQQTRRLSCNNPLLLSFTWSNSKMRSSISQFNSSSQLVQRLLKIYM